MSRGPLILFTAVFFLTYKLFAQVTIPNAGFEQPDPQSSTKTLYWVAENNNFICAAGKQAPYKGSYSLQVLANGGGNHFFNVEFPFGSQTLRKYRIRCAYRTKNLKGAVQLGAKVFDKDGGTITKTVFTISEEANRDWTLAEAVFVSEQGAAKLRVFGNLAGTGEVWLDEFSLEILPEPTKNPAPKVMLFIHEYFDLVYEHSIISDKNRIAELKSKTMYLCADSIDKNACYQVLQYYTTPKLRDGHSFFTSPRQWKEMMEEGKHPATGIIHHSMPEGHMRGDQIAYIVVPMFISSDPKLMQQYADSLQNIIAGFDKQNAKGYIIDLGKNGGGNSLPMIAGVGPLIGDGVCGYSFSGDGSLRTRIYRNGQTGWDSLLTFSKSNPCHLTNSNKPIAVIYSKQTGSSGEVTAISFIGLPNTRSFGQATAGANTRVDNFEMSDGAYLNLASGYNADRNRKKYTGSINPDVETVDSQTAIEEAALWILQNSK